MKKVKVNYRRDGRAKGRKGNCQLLSSIEFIHVAEKAIKGTPRGFFLNSTENKVQYHRFHCKVRMNARRVASFGIWRHGD